jgi:hypothetical protein
MDQAALIKIGLAGGVLYAIYRFAPNPQVKAMALGAAGVIAAKQLPYVKDIV